MQRRVDDAPFEHIQNSLGGMKQDDDQDQFMFENRLSYQKEEQGKCSFKNSIGENPLYNVRSPSLSPMLITVPSPNLMP